MAILLVLALAGCAQPPGRGGGIVSTNPCADAILVKLVAPGRIAAISRYSQDPASTSMPIDVARRFRATAGTAEEVIALKPDLVLASSFTAPATRAAFDRAGLRTVLLDSPSSIAASKAQVMQVATAVGAEARGRAINAAIDRAVLSYRPIHSVNWKSPDPSALLFISGDFANGGGTLLDEMMTRAGFTNAAAGYGLRFTGSLPAETIATHPPGVIIAPQGGSRGAALRQALLPNTPEVAFDRSLVNCGGPTIVPAMARLAAIRASLR